MPSVAVCRVQKTLSPEFWRRSGQELDRKLTESSRNWGDKDSYRLTLYAAFGRYQLSWQRWIRG